MKQLLIGFIVLFGLAPLPVYGAVGTVTFNQSVSGSFTALDMTAAKLVDKANSAYFLDPADTGNSLVTAGDATVSGNIALGNTKTLRSAFGPLQLQYKSGLDAWTTGFTLQDTTGRVGIGTTAPANLLNVSGLNDAGSFVAAAFDNTGTSANTQAGIIFRTGAGSNKASISGFAPTTGQEGYLIFATRPTSGAIASRMIIDNAGRVFIGGTTGAGYTTRVDLHYAGGGTEYGIDFLPAANNTSAAVFFNAAVSEIGSITTTSTATAYNTSSDRRLKENITDTALGLDALKRISVRDFHFISDPQKTKTQGFIAQELYTIYPYAVTAGGGDDSNIKPWSVDYGRLTPLIIKSIQEQQTQIASLSTEFSGFNLTSTGDLEIKNNSQTPYVYDGNQNIENQISNIKDQNYILKIKNEITDRIGAFGELWTAKITSGLIEAENAIISNTLIAKNAILETVVTKIINSEKITSPVVETTDLIATGSAQLNTIATNEITPQNGDLTIDLSSPNPPNLPNPPNAGALAKLIIKGLEGKSAVVIDAAGNASFSGQIIADSLTINNDATVSGNLDSNTLTTNEATVSGTLTAKEVQAENISNLTKTVFDQRQSLTDQNSSINDIQALLADIKNQPIPDPTNYQNIPSSTTNYELLTTNYLTVTGNSNLYNVSVSNSLLVGTTLIDQNSIISLASELKLSALSTINLFDGAVVIAKDGTITTQGELIAEKGIRTNEIKPLTDDGQVLINNLAINNLTINNISTNSAVIAASDNFDKNGLFAPAIETASASAGIGILPENSQEVVIYNNNIKENSLIYLTPTSSTASISQLAVGEKSTGEKPYFKVITNTPSTLPIKFNWLIIN